MAELPRVANATLHGVLDRLERRATELGHDRATTELLEHLEVDNPDLVPWLDRSIARLEELGLSPSEVAKLLVALSLKAIETELDIQMTRKLVGE